MKTEDKFRITLGLAILLLFVIFAPGCSVAGKKPVRNHGAHQVVPKECVRITQDCSIDNNHLHCPHTQVACTRVEHNE